MPEMPEVEVARIQLQKVLVGKVVVDAHGDVPKMISPEPRQFRKLLIGQRIIGVSRRAKLLILNLEGDTCAVFHFKLTGQLVYHEPGKPLLMVGHPMDSIKSVPNKFTHLTFTFKDGTRLYFSDLRKFAYVRLMEKCDLDKISEQNFGIEALSPDLDFKAFNRLLDRRPNNKVKQFLLNQQMIAGIGNIYADEILFYGRVRPTRQIKTLSESERKLLLKGIKGILTEAVEMGSTSYNPYIGEKEDEANYNPRLKAYQRDGLKCVRNDGGILKRIKLAGRSSHFCPVCQK